MDMSLSKLQDLVRTSNSGVVHSMGTLSVRQDWETEQQWILREGGCTFTCSLNPHLAEAMRSRCDMKQNPLYFIHKEQTLNFGMNPWIIECTLIAPQAASVGHRFIPLWFCVSQMVLTEQPSHLQGWVIRSPVPPALHFNLTHHAHLYSNAEGHFLHFPKSFQWRPQGEP